MPRSQARSSLKRKWRSENPMRDFDRLPPHLRQWLASADLPWRAKSVQRAYDKAVAETGDTEKALRKLDAMQSKRIAQDAARVWGDAHPATLS